MKYKQADIVEINFIWCDTESRENGRTVFFTNGG